MENGATEWITNLIQHVVRQKKNNELRKNMYIVLKVIMNGIPPDIRV